MGLLGLVKTRRGLSDVSYRKVGLQRVYVAGSADVRHFKG
jgi:hypothetical protein